MSKCTATLVFYQSGLSEVEPLLQALHDNPSLSAWAVVDNSASCDPVVAARLHEMVDRFGGRYVAAPGNLGFGAGHNLGLHELRDVASEFHVMLNPDLSFDPTVLGALAEVMETRGDVGMVMPRVRYPDGMTQSHCHLLPAPIDLALRRFASPGLKRLATARLDRYALADFDRSKAAEIPFLSGCFLFVRRSVLEQIGGFDERFFLYMEDVDLCRRIGQVARVLYWPSIGITHAHQRGSYKSRNLMLAHARSAIQYFNKWGWIFDTERSRMNGAALSRMPRMRPSEAHGERISTAARAVAGTPQHSRAHK